MPSQASAVRFGLYALKAIEMGVPSAVMLWGMPFLATLVRALCLILYFG